MKFRAWLLFAGILLVVLASFIIFPTIMAADVESEWAENSGLFGDCAKVQVGGETFRTGDNVYFSSTWIHYITTGGWFITVTQTEATFLGYYLRDNINLKTTVLGYWSHSSAVDKVRSRTPPSYTIGINGTCIGYFKNVITGETWARRATVDLWLPHV
ncbi:MAG: hypothetical protein ACP6IS_09705 [Candidatus Asgardarchaeia archaeon]